MIGTTLKVGYDASKVDRGLRGLKGKIGRVGRQIGIGMARQVGAGATDMLGRVLMAVPEAVRETGGYASGLKNISLQTGMTVKEVALLQEQLRLVGVDADESGTAISDMLKAIYEARTEPLGPARKALHNLNFFASDFEDKKPDEIFRMIGYRIAELGPSLKSLESDMEPIFGGDVGYKLLRAFKDFDPIVKQAQNNVGKLGDAMEKGDLAKNIERFAVSMGRFQTLKRSLASIALDELFKISGPNAGNDLFNSLDPEKIRPQIAKLTKSIRDLFGDLASGKTTISKEIDKIMRRLGKSLGEGIKDALGLGSGNILGKIMGGAGGGVMKDMKGIMNIKPQELLKKINPFNRSSSGNEVIESQLREQTKTLNRIATKQGIAIAI